ncbi:MAG: TRAP transporter substrate-binding protein [Peptococcaceae bacterium]|jgi:C4-dicarboxylate-binding protein DctP|nr:TRAP transporter substrate-binding protein [Peptococcaceae bacterium]MDH7525774.1 TRAP transporter substrate-binding protein [Peptococcaceae bacterium]
MNNSKKVYVSVLLIIVLVAFAALSGCSGASSKQSAAPAGNEGQAQGGQVTLKLSYPNTETSLTGQAYNYFAKCVEEESKGQIKVQVYPAASLVSNKDALDAVRKGNVDIAHFVVSYISPTIKELTPFEVPGAYRGDKYMELDKATHSIVEKIFAKYGVKYIAPSEQGGTTTFTSMKKLIKSPADLKGLKVRVSGKWIGEAIKLWGGSPVTIPLGDLPVALERNTVDVAYCGWTITGPQKLYETAHYITFTTLQEIFGGLMMSEKAWNALTKEQQADVQRAAEKLMVYMRDLSAKMKQDTIDAIKNANGTVYHLTDAENAEFVKATKSLMEQVKGISGPEGEELIKSFEALQ